MERGVEFGCISRFCRLCAFYILRNSDCMAGRAEEIGDLYINRVLT